MIGLRRSTVRAALADIRSGGFPWAPFATAEADPLERRLRRRARRLAIRRWPKLLRPFAAVAMGLVWPVTSLLEAIDDVRAADPAALGGRRRSRLALAAWRAALLNNVPPFEYLAYRMFEGPRRGAGAWLVRDDLARVNRALASPEALHLAHDKHEFWLFCSEAGLPAVPTLARYARGQPAEPFDGGAAPAHDLVVKPRRGASAIGVEAWRHHDGLYLSAAGRSPLDAAALEERFVALSRRYGEVLVQPLLCPHPGLSALGERWVPTARIITACWPDGRIEIIDALVQRLVEDAPGRRRGRQALVAPETGRVRDDLPGQDMPVFPAYSLDPAFRGLAVPDWGACRAAVLDAHAAFPRPAPLLGWDVGLAEHGPVLIETNVSQGFIHFQVASLRPALRGSLRAWLGAWLEARP